MQWHVQVQLIVTFDKMMGVEALVSRLLNAHSVVLWFITNFTCFIGSSQFSGAIEIKIS